MYKTVDIVREYGIDEEELNFFLKKNQIPLIQDSEINKKYFQAVLSFIEKKDDRIEKRIGKAEATFRYNANKNNVAIYQDDAVSFLEKLPSNSVDLIVTDPAYSG